MSNDHEYEGPGCQFPNAIIWRYVHDGLHLSVVGRSLPDGGGQTSARISPITLVQVMMDALYR